MDVKLKAKHIIMFSKMVSKMNIKLESSERDATKIGINIVLDIIKNVSLAESEFYELVGSLAGVDSARIADTDIEEIIDVLRMVVNKVINFTQKPEPTI